MWGRLYKTTPRCFCDPSHPHAVAVSQGKVFFDHGTDSICFLFGGNEERKVVLDIFPAYSKAKHSHLIPLCVGKILHTIGFYTTKIIAGVEANRDFLTGGALVLLFVFALNEPIKPNPPRGGAGKRRVLGVR